MAKPKLTMNDLFEDEVKLLNSATTKLGKMDEEFAALIPRNEGKASIPDDPEERKDFFIDLVSSGCSIGLTEKQIVDNLKLLSWKDTDGVYHTLGEKTAKTIYRHTVEAIGIELVLEEFKENKIGDDEADAKRVANSFWKKEDVTKCQQQNVPTVVVLNYKNAAALKVESAILAKEMAKIKETTWGNTLRPLQSTLIAAERSLAEFQKVSSNSEPTPELIAKLEELTTAVNNASAAIDAEETRLASLDEYASKNARRYEIIDTLKNLALDLKTSVFDRLSDARKEFFNRPKTSTRGRGANIYASIGSELE